MVKIEKGITRREFLGLMGTGFLAVFCPWKGGGVEPLIKEPETSYFSLEKNGAENIIKNQEEKLYPEISIYDVRKLPQSPTHFQFLSNDQIKEANNWSDDKLPSVYPIGPYVGSGKLFEQVAKVKWVLNELGTGFIIVDLVKPGEEGYWYKDGNCRTCGNVAGYYFQQAPPETQLVVLFPRGVVVDGKDYAIYPAGPDTMLYYHIQKP